MISRVAGCEVSEGVRTFRVDRILGAAATGAPVEIDERFDADAYVQGHRGDAVAL